MRVTGSGVHRARSSPRRCRRFTVLSAAGEGCAARPGPASRSESELRAVRCARPPPPTQLDRLRHDVGPVQMLAELFGGDVIGGVLRALLICEPTILSAPASRRIALRRPHRPFAVRAAEQGDEQLARLDVPQPHRLVGRARDEEAAIGEGARADIASWPTKLPSCFHPGRKPKACRRLPPKTVPRPSGLKVKERCCLAVRRGEFYGYAGGLTLVQQIEEGVTACSGAHAKA